MPHENLTPGDDDSYIPIWAPAKGSDPSLRPAKDAPSSLLTPQKKTHQKSDKDPTENLSNNEAIGEKPSNPKAEALAIFLASVTRGPRRG